MNYGAYQSGPETGLAPLLIAAATKVWSVIQFIGGMIAFDAATDFVASQFGDTDEVLAPVFEPLTPGARRYYLEVDFTNWDRASRARFSGPALQSALAAVQRAQQIVQAPDSTLLDVHGAAKGLSDLFESLHAKPSALGGGDAVTPHWWQSIPIPSTTQPTPAPSPSSTTAPVTSTARTPAGVAQASSSGAVSSPVGAVVGLAVLGLGAWWLFRSSRPSRARSDD